MAHMINCTASTLRAVLCYIDPESTPKIAYDKDDYTEQLIARVKEAVGDRDGSQSVSIILEGELARQFAGVCKNIKACMSSVVFCLGGETELRL